MLDDFLQERAALYVSGALTPDEREQVEWRMEYHEELRALVADLSEAALALTLTSPRGAMPPPALGARILSAIGDRRQMGAESFVLTGLDGLVQWVSPAFTAMCGYALDELQGRKLGPILQGAGTDPGAVERMRSAVHAHRPCRETIVNYHKDGRPYWVEIAINPILDEDGRPHLLAARERELTGRALPA